MLRPGTSVIGFVKPYGFFVNVFACGITEVKKVLSNPGYWIESPESLAGMSNLFPCSCKRSFFFVNVFLYYKKEKGY